MKGLIKRRSRYGQSLVVIVRRSTPSVFKSSDKTGREYRHYMSRCGSGRIKPRINREVRWRELEVTIRWFRSVTLGCGLYDIIGCKKNWVFVYKFKHNPKGSFCLSYSINIYAYIYICVYISIYIYIHTNKILYYIYHVIIDIKLIFVFI